MHLLLLRLRRLDWGTKEVMYNHIRLVHRILKLQQPLPLNPKPVCTFYHFQLDTRTKCK